MIKSVSPGCILLISRLYMGWFDEKKNLSALSQYAKKLRVHTKVAELMEVLLNG